jgi:prophage antirepressor-like protein
MEEYKTMSNIRLFEYKGKRIRTDDIDGVVWFVAKDVCEALEISWSGSTLGSIKPDWQRMIKLITPRGEQELKAISEPALYKLAFRSNKAEAERFTDWVAEEVLPQIRKTGRYEAEPQGLVSFDRHAQRDVQIAMSKKVNAYQYYRGGKKEIMRYNIDNCKAHTGKHTKTVRNEGKAAGLKSKERNSAKEVIRHLQPALACCMSLADNLTEQGHDEVKVFKVTPKAQEVFEGIIALGAMPPELLQTERS